MPSGSTRMTLASLYSLPLIVLKSSEKPSDAKDKIKAVTSFLFTFCRSYVAFLFSYPGLFGQGEFTADYHVERSETSLVLYCVGAIGPKVIRDSSIHSE